MLVEGGESFKNSKNLYIDISKRISAIAISQDGHYIVSGSSWGNSIKLWDREKGVLIKTFEGHTSSVNSVTISQDGRYIVSGSYDKSIKLWDIEKGVLIKTFKGHTNDVRSIAISQDGRYIVSGSRDNSIKLWDMEKGVLIKTFEGHTSIVDSVTISQDGRYIVSGSYDKSIKLWDIEKGVLIKTFEGHTSDVYSIAISRDGHYIVSGSSNNSIKLWDIEKGVLIKTFEGHKNDVRSIAISQDGRYIVSGSSDNSIKLWDIEKGVLIKTFEGHKNDVRSIAISQDGRYIVSGSYDNSIKLWDIEKRVLIKTFEGHKNFVRSVSIKQDEHYIVSGSSDNSIKLWDIEKGVLIKTFEGHKNDVKSIAISQNGRYIVSGSYDNSIKLWDIEKGVLIKTFKGHISDVNSVTISRDGRYIVSGSYDNNIKLWDMEKGVLIKTFEGHTNNVKSIAISQDGRYIVSGSSDNSVKLWDRKKGVLIKTFEGHTSSVSSVAISQDGHYIVSSSVDKSIKLWDIEKRVLIKTFKGHTSYVTSVAISQDGRYIVSGSSDNLIKLWDREKGVLIKTFEGHTRYVTSVTISQDGRYIISSSLDGSIKLWDRKKGVLIKEYIGGVRGNWLVKDFKKELLFRGDDGTFLLKKEVLSRDKNATVSKIRVAYPKEYNLTKNNDKLIVSIETKDREMLNDSSMELNISIKNSGESSYFIRAYTKNEYFTIEQNTLSYIKKGERKNLFLKIHAKLPRQNPKPLVRQECNLSIVTGNGSEFNISIPISVRYANIVVKKAEVSKDRKTLNMDIFNIGNETVKNAKVKLLKPFESNIQEIKHIETNTNVPIAFAIDSNFSMENNMSVALSVYIPNIKEQQNNPKTEVAPAYVWQVEGVKIVLNKLAWYIYILWVLGVLALLGLIIYFKRYKNALVLQLQRNPKALLTLSPNLLNEAKKRLSNINELDTILENIGIDKKRLDESIEFGREEDRAEIFASRIKKSVMSRDGEFYKINCKDTELSIDDFVLYFSDETAEQIEETLRGRGDRFYVVGSAKNQESIAKLARDKTNNIIATTQEGLSEFLLSPKSEEVFMKILAECLEFSSISPYQTSGGIQKEMDFFGRIEIVRDIKMNSNKNYMIVGGRQLGKSSILRKLYRSYASSTSVDCRFINMERMKGDIVLAMAKNFGMAKNSNLDDVLAYIIKADKKMLLLIDEVDEFIEPEVKKEYEILKALKNLAEEGKANFVLAGYWTLYQYVTADYQSPLYNFGELIVLEGLEKKACKELMLEPMRRIGVSYEDETVLDEVISACGQRANLIATICDGVLKKLDSKLINKKQLDKVMQSDVVGAKLQGWGNIDSENNQNSRLDRIIIYLTIDKEQFELDEVLALLEHESISVGATAVNESLERLVIAYILKKDLGHYSYRVPLMKEKLLQTNEKGRRALLSEEIDKF